MEKVFESVRVRKNVKMFIAVILVLIIAIALAACENNRQYEECIVNIHYFQPKDGWEGATLGDVENRNLVTIPFYESEFGKNEEIKRYLLEDYFKVEDILEIEYTWDGNFSPESQEYKILGFFQKKDGTCYSFSITSNIDDDEGLYMLLEEDVTEKENEKYKEVIDY